MKIWLSSFHRESQVCREGGVQVDHERQPLRCLPGEKMTLAIQLGPETSACDKKESLLLHPQSNTLKRLADLSAPLRESWQQKLSSPTPSYLTGAVVFFSE